MEPRLEYHGRIDHDRATGWPVTRRREEAENFRTEILNSKNATSVQTPVRTLGPVTYMYLRHSDVYIVCLAKNNPNVMMTFKFMTSVSEC
eukprot:361451-Chlamydomonas_euryale.AAC.4